MQAPQGGPAPADGASPERLPEPFRVPAEVRLANLREVRANGDRYLRDAGDHAVFSLAGVTTGDSAVVALLMSWYRSAHALGKTIEFTDIPGEVRNIIDLSGLTDVLPLRAAATVDGTADGTE